MLKANEEEFVKQEDEEEMMDDDVRQKLNADPTLPLAMRLFKKTQGEGEKKELATAFG